MPVRSRIIALSLTSATAAVLASGLALAAPADAAGPGHSRPFGSTVRHRVQGEALRLRVQPPVATVVGPAVAGPTAPVTWPDGVTRMGWHSDFTGYGSITRGSDGAITLSPATATNPGETHASLLTSVPAYGDLDVSTTVTTVDQHRAGSAPNAWEVGWFLWHHSDNTHFYYVSLKPNGLELGKEDPAYPGAQRFLATNTTSYPIGSTHTVRVVQQGAAITVAVDGVDAFHFTDEERPYLTGHLGLYDEDSTVRFTLPQVAAT